jgi:hypothetical protein
MRKQLQSSRPKPRPSLRASVPACLRASSQPRPGSVLILVVVLLVLLALIGTAFINTAQSDRYSSAQNSFNTQVELLLQGLESVTQGTVANSLFVRMGSTPAVFHGLDESATPIPSAMTDYPLNRTSCFLADRYPTMTAQGMASPASIANRPIWRFLSVLPTLAKACESPYVTQPGVTPPSPQGYIAPPAPAISQQGLLPLGLSPCYITIPQGTSTQTFPALTDGTNIYLAADTDGDGVADAALFRLPAGQLNGITWYAAVRIIDNCAAINAATAMAPNFPAPSLPVLPGNFFPSNIDFYGVLTSADQPANYATFNTAARFNGQASPTLTPYQDSGNPRGDFAFGTAAEAFWMQVGRRLTNPGYYGFGAGFQYTALPASESQTMARRFILRDPSIGSAAGSSSLLEKYLPNSVYNSAPTQPYAPGDSTPAAAWTTIANWYNGNFDYVNNPGGLPIRSMLVARNGVSNFTYSKLHSMGAWQTTTLYNFGDWVTYTDPGTSLTRSYVCMQQNTAQQPKSGVSTAYWEPQPWSSGPTKASANTATFGQLWSAYYSAMSETPVTATAAGSVSARAWKAMFDASLRTLISSSLNWQPTSVASPGPAGFPQLQLRAAIAAINTLQLRNPNSASASAIPLHAQITLNDTTGTPAFNAIVYGSAPQPYITEVYANTMGGSLAQDYVAVELYNPYPFDITMTGWQLATVNRAGGTATPLTATPLTSTTTGATSWATSGPIIKANGYLVLANSLTYPAGITPNSMTATTTASPPTLIILPDLANALDNELVLLRPSGAAAVPSWLTGGTETATAPVDSYEFTGLDPNDSIGHDWYYIRPSDATAGKAWHFVYPGPYAGTGTVMSPREAGTLVNTGMTPQLATMATFGAPDSATAILPTNTASSYIDRPLQINNTAFGGPNKAAASNNAFPYGGFARNADLLQVTCVGAYQITDTTGTKLYELNALPADSAMADDPVLNKDTNAVTAQQAGRENIGRFTPVHWSDTPSLAAVNTELLAQQAGNVPDDYWTADANSQTGYFWTFRLFDYLTVQSPQDDYLPDVDPAAGIYPGTAPVAVANANANIANASTGNKPASATEEVVPVQGRININTANWRVLAALPFFDNNQAANNDMAKAIVYYRDVDDGTVSGSLHPHGAFQSIEELNNVPVTGTTNPVPQTTLVTPGTMFRNSFGTHTTSLFTISGLHGSNTDGDLSPNSAGAGADQVDGDFENQNLALSRISNLLTTRSDSFTAYIMVQGWRNAATDHPELVVQRRAAFIIDRSAITPGNNTELSVTNVPGG